MSSPRLVNDQPANPSRPGSALFVPVVLVGALVLVLVSTWRPLPPPPTSPVSLPELSRTNLFRYSGVWIQKGRTNPFTGVMLDYYPDGMLMSRSVVSNGLLNGLSQGWYTNHQLQVQETYHTNYSDGLRTKWYPNGQKQSEAWVTLSKISGLYRRWYPDGVLAEEIPMRDGQIEGLGRAYYESGFVKAEVTYHDGKVTDQHTWKDGEHAAPGQGHVPAVRQGAGRGDGAARQGEAGALAAAEAQAGRVADGDAGRAGAVDRDPGAQGERAAAGQ